MRILICGDRHFDDAVLMEEVIREHFTGPGDTLIHGCARGADILSEIILNRVFDDWGNLPSIERYPADWDKYGKAAGPIRNKQMLTEGKPDLVVGFLTAKSKGTYNMLMQANKAGVPVREIKIGDWS